MEDDGEKDQPINNRSGKVEDIPLFLIGCIAVGEEVAHVFAVKHGSYTNRSKVAHEESLFDVMAHLGHELVHQKNSGDTSKGHNHEAKADESGDRHAGAIGVVEFAPRKNSSNKHESTKVEKNIETVVDFIVSLIRLGEEIAVPVEEVASNEAGKQVVGAHSTTSADNEETDSDREEQVGLLIDPPPVSCR